MQNGPFQETLLELLMHSCPNINNVNVEMILTNLANCWSAEYIMILLVIWLVEVIAYKINIVE